MRHKTQDIRLSFNLNIDDWVAFRQYHRGKEMPFFKLFYPLILALGFVLAAINIYHVCIDEISNVTWFSFIVLAILLYVLYIRKKAMREIRKAGMDIRQKHPEAFGLITMTFDEAGINIQSGKTSKSITWHEMFEFEENKHYFFLYSKKGVVYIIPKRGIESPSSFRDILINYFPNE